MILILALCTAFPDAQRSISDTMERELAETWDTSDWNVNQKAPRVARNDRWHRKAPWDDDVRMSSITAAEGAADDARNWDRSMSRYLSDFLSLWMSSFIEANSGRNAADRAQNVDGAMSRGLWDFMSFFMSSFIEANSGRNAADRAQNVDQAMSRGLRDFLWLWRSSFIEANSGRKDAQTVNGAEATRPTVDKDPHSETTGKRPSAKPITSFDDDRVARPVHDAATNENILSIAKTIIFSDGKCMSEVNSLSDAIIHCRSGCGKPVKAGSGLIAEMEADKTLNNYMVKPNSHVEGVAAAKVREVAWGQKKGTLSFTEKSQVFNCQTLGGYVGNLDASVDYTCSYSGNTRTCKFTGKGVLTGKDIWDFESHPEWPLWKNMIREILPSFLVSLRGKMKEFDINFNVTRSFSGTVEQTK